MNGFMTAHYAARKWGVTPRQVQILCKEKRIVGAVQMSRVWIIPEDAEKPTGEKKLIKKKRVDLSDAPWTMHEFFAGSGLVAYGLKNMFSPVWANDISEQKADVYNANFESDHFELGDIQDIKGQTLPYAHLSWASFPCQDLSLAGAMGGIHAARSGLVWEWLRVLDEMECKPKMIIAGASAYARTIDFKKFREIADACGALLMVDIAHIAGLVAAGLHPSPIPYADVVTTTTHKTLRGPRGGMIMASQEVADKYNFNKAVFPGIQGGPLMHVIAAKAVCFKEALDPAFKEYQQGVIDNAQALCKALMDRDIKIVSGGTDNHLMLVDLTPYELTGKAMEKLLDAAHITCNKNTIPNDPKSPFVTSGLRLGTPAVTSRGLKPEDMDKIAEAIAMLIKEGESAVDKARAIVDELTAKYPLK